MTIMWMAKRGGALMGKVLEETKDNYVVQVTSFERRSNKNLVGKKFLVRKEHAVMATVEAK